MDEAVRKYLDTLYHDVKHPAAYSGVDKLYRAVKTEGLHRIPRSQIKKWLQSQENYTIQKQMRHKFKRR